MADSVAQSCFSNQTIEEGGFVGESKGAILAGLGRATESGTFISPWVLLEKALSSEARAQLARQFIQEHGLSFPVVMKPDAGERGRGVAVVRSELELDEYLRLSNGDVIIQKHAGGQEFGVFYYRYPGTDRGHILSITKKLFPCVIGDGESTLEKLILKDGRAVCMARAYFDVQRGRLWDVPAKGETVQLIEIGTHCLGSVFLDGVEIKTAAMEEAIDRLAKGFAGFYFGRFDIRTPSLSDFQQGRNFKIVELNGVTSEATSIYDRKNSLFIAYRVLFNQWRIAFEIGSENRARGAVPASVFRLAQLILKKWRKTGERSGAEPRQIDTEVRRTSQLATGL